MKNNQKLAFSVIVIIGVLYFLRKQKRIDNDDISAQNLVSKNLGTVPSVIADVVKDSNSASFSDTNSGTWIVGNSSYGKTYIFPENKPNDGYFIDMIDMPIGSIIKL